MRARREPPSSIQGAPRLFCTALTGLLVVPWAKPVHPLLPGDRSPPRPHNLVLWRNAKEPPQLRLNSQSPTLTDEDALVLQASVCWLTQDTEATAASPPQGYAASTDAYQNPRGRQGLQGLVKDREDELETGFPRKRAASPGTGPRESLRACWLTEWKKVTTAERQGRAERLPHGPCGQSLPT